MKPFIQIKNRKIGYDFDPLVIAEIGINHEGSLQTAFEMVDAAFNAGAEIVKHQTHIVEDEMSGAAKKVIPGNADVSIYEIMERCALSESDEIKLKQYVESKGMIFISTPFSRAAADRLQRMDVAAYKIGSGECNNYPLLEHIAKFGKPVIMSTGMNSIDSISKAVNIFRKNNIQFALLHCTNIYPTPPHLVRLEAVRELEEKFPDAVVGLSDHTINNYACLGAVALGASILERHFTDNMDRPGPDIVCSMDTKAMKHLIEGSKFLKQERGGFKGPVKEEQATIDFAYATVVSIKDIKAGDQFTIDNIWVKRPGTGEIQAEHFKLLIGKIARVDIVSDSQLKWEHVSKKRRIVFLTGTRADFGKLKSLIDIVIRSNDFEVYIFATGMHLQKKYGYTYDEIEKCGYKNIFKYINHTQESSMDQTLGKTIEGLSNYVKQIQPDLIVVHGDRVETLSGAIVGALNNILVAHIEGGEVSGTIDELIRHAVSKISHTHFVSNQIAKNRLIQMGEVEKNIFVIGSPDVDAMLSNTLPDIIEVKKRYNIPFNEYALLIFHPVTTEIEFIALYAKELVDAILESKENYVVIFPNNDMGSILILQEYERLKDRENIKIFPSVRFEYFLVMLKHAHFLIGNSSAGIREAPYYGLPVINIGSRQQNRALHEDIINCGYGKAEILSAVESALNSSFKPINLFGRGDSNELFYKVISEAEFWQISKQKQFNDLATYA